MEDGWVAHIQKWHLLATLRCDDAVTVVTIRFRTATSKIAMLRPPSDGVTVVTVLTSANLTRVKRESKRRLATKMGRMR